MFIYPFGPLELGKLSFLEKKGGGIFTDERNQLESLGSLQDDKTDQ